LPSAQTAYAVLAVKRRAGGRRVRKNPTKKDGSRDVLYDSVLGEISDVIDAARMSAARSVNCVMTAAYWLIGRRIVEFEQRGEKRAAYGAEVVKRLSDDLTTRYGRGFSGRSLRQMRQFYLHHPPEQIRQTVSGKSEDSILQTSSGELETPAADAAPGKWRTVFAKSEAPILSTPSRELETRSIEDASGKPQTLSADSFLNTASERFPLPWSAYVRLLTVKNERARKFYETEVLTGGWSVRQLKRQINSQFYERTALSRNKA
jgi:hypothetical protein